MSERENIQQIEQIFAAFNRGDVPYILSQFADDAPFVSHLDPVVPWSGDYSGKSNVPRFFMAMGGAVEVSAHPVRQIIAQGDTVVATGDVSFRVRSSGKAADSTWVYIFKLREGRIISYDQFNDARMTAAFR